MNAEFEARGRREEPSAAPEPGVRRTPMVAARRPLAVAAAVSVLAHVLLLAAALPALREPALRGPAVIQRFQASLLPAPEPAPSPPAPLPPSAATPRESPPPAPVRSAKARPSQATAPAAAGRAPASPTLPGTPAAVPSSPLLQDLAPDLVARRLPVTLTVDPEGFVRTAEVEANEVSPELARRIGEALVGLRFPAGGSGAEGTEPSLRSLLCFDDAGALDTASDECWKAAPPPRGEGVRGS